MNTNDILTLINPYYDSQIIEKHLDILIKHGKVAFGKIKSKVNQNNTHPEANELEKIYTTTKPAHYIQLFVTDYANMYVFRVIEVIDTPTPAIKPSYYANLEVEKWFIADDLRVIVEHDFEKVRDVILSNFTTPQFENHTFIVYGNRYHYPMIVNQKEHINYFEQNDENFKYYTYAFKTPEQLQIRNDVIHYCIGEKRFNQLSPNTQDNLINAELEFKHNCHNNLYDFTSVILKYTKSFEYEIHSFFKIILGFLIEKNSTLGNIIFNQNGISKNISSILVEKANLGTYLFLLKHDEIKQSIDANISNVNIKKFIVSSLPYFIKVVQNIRNENVHGKIASLNEAKELRAEMIGIGKVAMLVEIVKNKNKLRQE